MQNYVIKFIKLINEHHHGIDPCVDSMGRLNETGHRVGMSRASLSARPYLLQLVGPIVLMLRPNIWLEGLVGGYEITCGEYRSGPSG